MRGLGASNFYILVRQLLLGLTGTVIIAALYRRWWIDATDPFKCGALLTGGSWLASSQGPHHNQSLRNWQPPGCMLHDYQAKDITACLESRKIVFIGDSTIRQVFWATAKKLDQHGAEKEMAETEKHSDARMQRGGVSLEFICDPFLNSNRLREELTVHRDEGTIIESGLSRLENSTTLILIGGGLWFASYIPVNYLGHFKDAMDAIGSRTSSIELIAHKSLQGGTYGRSIGASNLLLVTPVQAPRFDLLSRARSARITPERISSMNGYLEELSRKGALDVTWSYSLMTLNQTSAYEESGLHVADVVAARKADVLLNLRCNARHATQAGHTYPNDRTCCSSYPRPGWTQWIGLVAGLGVMPGLYWMSSQGSQYWRLAPGSKLWYSFIVFSMAVCYCFITDRTHLFNKVHKLSSSYDFCVLAGAVLILGVMTLRRSKATTMAKPGGPATSQDMEFLSRYQTDEWKGWMQFIILIYHYTGTSKVLWIYEIIRLFVASYLFMTGYGHTVYFLKKRDYSFRRVAAVLIRLNMLSCVLPYMMKTDYVFYYFAPLVSFWFLVLYFTLRSFQSLNENTTLLVGKIMVSAIIVTAFTKLRGPLEAVFSVLDRLCHIHWNVNEWRFRVYLDMFIVYIGMLSGILLIKLTSQSSQLNQERLFSYVQQHFRLVRILVTVISILLFPTFWALTRRFPTKFDYNHWQPYISPLPILAYIILRNSHRHLRNYHSSVFAWLGQCSLETFTLQYHIWLAADTKGLLSIGVFDRSGRGRWVDFVLLTMVFLWVSHCVAEATNAITKWILDGGDAKQCSELELPMLELSVSKSQDFVREKGRTNEWFGGAISLLAQIWKKDLRLRLGLLLALMWILNLTST